ncbi:hypothetical protein [Bacillus sp. B15-48]|nr:hypothetical protein [Bacillus sp. B15-48]MBM4764760.1 hypothetical protein [Bacillus sp. B15-48]
MTNIIDGMDAVRFQSKNATANKLPKKKENEKKDMPMVLKNLKNGS